MRTLRQRYAVASSALALVAPLVLYLNYSVPPPTDMKAIGAAIPRTLLDKWEALGEDRGGSKDEIEILQTDSIFTRTYWCRGLPNVELSIVAAQDNPNAIHPPELCYTGNGWTETGRGTVSVGAAEGQHVLNLRHFARGGANPRRLVVLYWFKAGPKNTASYPGFHWAALKARLLRAGCACALIQVRAEFDDPRRESDVLTELQKLAAVALPHVNSAIK